MSAAAAPTAPAGAAPAKGGKKKLIVIVLAVVLLLVLAGGGAMFYLKKKAAKDDGDDSAAHTADAHAEKRDLKHPPTFVPLEPFVVNLTDRDTDRYAQVGITFEVVDEHFAGEMKGFMPAIRNGVLLILSHKSSRDLLDRGGKEKLADEILRDASRTLGIEVDDPEDEVVAEGTDKHAAASDNSDDEAPKPKKKKKKKHAAEPNPIQHVNFSNLIVQ